MMKRIREMAALIFPLVMLALAWAGGEVRRQEASLAGIRSISADIVGITRVNDYLFRGHRKDNPAEVLYIAIVDKPSYGGLMRVAAVVNGSKELEHVAIMSSHDTSTYLAKVVGMGILDAFPGKTLGSLPRVDGVTGATLSSTAVIRGLELAAARIGTEEFGLPEVAAAGWPATPEKTKLLVIFLLFGSALTITRKSFPLNRKVARYLLMGVSVITLGFMYGAQFSLSTIVALLVGGGLAGLASHAAALCLVLAVAVVVISGQNLFCTYICPFGAVQEGLGRISGCPVPSRRSWMILAARGWTLTVLAAALYFRAPSDAIYEPFGMVFNFIGSGLLFLLTILIVISSLAFRRPWCLLFCPVTCLFDYLQYVRRMLGGKGGSAKTSPTIQEAPGP